MKTAPFNGVRGHKPKSSQKAFGPFHSVPFLFEGIVRHRWRTLTNDAPTHPRTPGRARTHLPLRMRATHRGQRARAALRRCRLTHACPQLHDRLVEVAGAGAVQQLPCHGGMRCGQCGGITRQRTQPRHHTHLAQRWVEQTCHITSPNYKQRIVRPQSHVMNMSPHACHTAAPVQYMAAGSKQGQKLHGQNRPLRRHSGRPATHALVGCHTNARTTLPSTTAAGSSKAIEATAADVYGPTPASRSWADGEEVCCLVADLQACNR
jgi:hypothetical protein